MTTQRVTIPREKKPKFVSGALSIFQNWFIFVRVNSQHWYAIGDEPWQPLFAPLGQETVVLEAVAQAMPGVPVKLAKQVNDEMQPVATCFMASAGSRDHAVVYARPVTVPVGEKQSA